MSLSSALLTLLFILFLVIRDPLDVLWLDGIMVLNTLGSKLTSGTGFGLKLAAHLMVFSSRLKEK